MSFFIHCGGSSKFTLSSGQEKSLQDCVQLREKRKYEQAIKCFEAYKSRHYGQASAAEAELAIADSYFSQKEYLVAAEAYNFFAESYPSHPKLPYALYRSALSYFNEAPKTIDRDLTYLYAAQRRLQPVLSYYNQSSYANEAKDLYESILKKLAKQNYYVARFYYKYNELLAAIPRFQTVITEFPNLGFDNKSYYYLIKALKETDQKDLAYKYFEIYKSHFAHNTKWIKKIQQVLK